MRTSDDKEIFNLVKQRKEPSVNRAKKLENNISNGRKIFRLLLWLNEISEIENMINNKKMMLELGSFSNNFTYIAATNSSFEERRSNLQGYQIKAMTGPFSPFAIIDYNIAILDIESQTYDVTSSVKGLDIDLLKDMQNYMNFSTTLHERQDKKWGPITALDNGTIIPRGIVESVTSDFAEMIVSG